MRITAGMSSTPRSFERWDVESSRRVQSRVERERLLKLQAIESCGLERVENQVPAMSGHRARNRHEAMATKKIVAEGLLARIEPPVATSWGLARRRV